MDCPKCGEQDLYRDEVDVGIGIMYGPYGCSACGWSEDSRYDISGGPKYEGDYAVDQWGGLIPPVRTPQCQGCGEETNSLTGDQLCRICDQDWPHRF